MENKKFICACYLYRNIFLKKYNIHVTFKNEDQFQEDHKMILQNKGCDTAEKFEEVLKIIKDEIHRRKCNSSQSHKRKETILRNYRPLHKDVFTLQPSFLSNHFLDMVSYAKSPTATRDGLMNWFTKINVDEVFILPIFNKEFCETFLEELQHFEQTDLPKGRPNSMNSSGILLEELGFYPSFFDVLRQQYLSAISNLLYPNWTGSSGLDSQRAFVVSYDINKNKDETDLDMHYDNAEVTLNVSINEDFTGGDLFFADMRNQATNKWKQVVHRQGYGVLHRGRHYHGAMPLESGSRYNLIIWMRSSSIRNQLCPMCDEVPKLIPVENDGDGFIDSSVNVCALN